MSLLKREARLQQMRDRLSDETGEEREARLQQMRTSQRERRSTEMADETEARLQHDRESRRERRSTETADFNVTDIATGSSEHLASHSSHLFNNTLFKQR